MRYTKFKDISLSLLGMGAMRLPQEGEGWGLPIIHDQAEALIDYCMAQGINYYDTAYIYHNGESEVFLGKTLSKYPRDSYYVADKYNLPANADYKAQFEEQLERLQMDYIDFYLLHGISDDKVDEFLTNGCIEYFIEQKNKGKIKYLGFSLHATPPVLPKITARYDFDFAMIQLNYLDWHYGPAKELYNHLREKNIAIMVMEPVHGGLLAKLNNDECETMLKNAEPNRTIASWAIRFVADLPDITVILSGMSTIEQAKDNITIINENTPLSESDKALIFDVSTKLTKSIAVTCTSCKYCVNDCPQQLDIPTLLGVYNEYKTSGVWRLGRLKGLPEDKQPKGCTHCGICKPLCPQNIDIPECMQDMEKAME
ncbi:MAG: aldo/keto reductase [Defluviitaleaceae bacterium]|nr:aldo/keto reductase [Defluviitaleaceae bacterium]